MNLTIEQISDLRFDDFQPGAKVSLSNNGDREVRMRSLRVTKAGYESNCLSLRDARVTFHMDDLDTTIQLEGYLVTNAIVDAHTLYRKIVIWLK